MSSLSRETTSPGGGGRGNFLSPTQGWEVSASASPPHGHQNSFSPPSYIRASHAGSDQGRAVVVAGGDGGGGSSFLHRHPGRGGRHEEDGAHPSSRAISPSGTEVSGLDQVLLELVEGHHLGRFPMHVDPRDDSMSPLPDSDVLLREKVFPSAHAHPDSIRSPLPTSYIPLSTPNSPLATKQKINYPYYNAHRTIGIIM